MKDDTPFESMQDRMMFVDLVLTDQTNHNGVLFGGAALAHMDKLAYLTAARHGRRPFVTAATEGVEFRTPVKYGHLMELTGQVAMVGRSSLKVRVDLIMEDLLSGERQLCTRGGFVMVASDRKTNPAPLPPVPSTRSEVSQDRADGATSMVELVFPKDVDHHGHLFGGAALSLMEKAAFIAATRASRKNVLMASSEKIDFLHPVHQGDMVLPHAYVDSYGRSSMQTHVEMWGENPLTGETWRCTKGTFIMVALDEKGHPTPARSQV